MSPGKTSSRPTLADVAALAGVSPSTASSVINDVAHARVAAETRERVLAAVAELGYRPNAAARGLRTQRTHTFGFISDDIATSPFAGETITGAQETAWAHQHLLLIANTGGDDALQQAAIEAMLDRQIDGLIVAAMYAREIDVSPLRALPVPCVLLNCFGHEPGFPEVIPDDERGGYEAGRVLVEAGHTRIGFINGEADQHASVARMTGFRRALAVSGLAPEPELLASGNWWPDSGYEHAHRLLELPEPPTAIFCGNDRMAVGVFEALKERGLDIPGDVSVLGFDDMELARHLRPSLSTMALPHSEMGRWACRRLLDGDTRPLRETLRCPAHMRDSVGPPKAAS